MVLTNELDCKILVEGTLSLEDLANLVAKILAGTVSQAALQWTVHMPAGEMEVRLNPEADPDRARVFPDGFLFFRYALEFYPSPEMSQQDRRAGIRELLGKLWEKNLPAVAACDYEQDLPYQGGYNRTEVPWVSPAPVSS